MNERRILALLTSSALLLHGCGGGGGGSGATNTATPGAGATMDIFEASNGFGRMLPHEAFKADGNGQPTSQVVSIRTMDDLIANVGPGNPVFPPPQWPETAILPDGQDGNHFLYIKFTQKLDVDSVLSASPAAQVNSGLTGTVTIVGIDPLTGAITPIKGRAFVGGRTYAGQATGDPPQLELQRWVKLANDGTPVPNKKIDNNDDGVPDGLGFPGSETGIFAGVAELAHPNTLLFIPDADGDLRTHETFPQGLQIRARITTSVVATNGKALIRRGLASSTVGGDVINPEVLLSPPPFSFPTITPGNGDQNVDPLTDISVEFSEPVDITTIGNLPNGSAPTVGAGVVVTFGPSASTVTVPFTVEPHSVYDMSRVRLVPAFNFPGSGPVFQQCGVFNEVTVTVNSGQLADLTGNMNQLGPQTQFTTGEGPGIVNAPVSPDTIYLGRVGSQPAISVIDLNGFGQSTGNPTHNPLAWEEGNTNFPNNPNVAFQPQALIPPLQIGACTVNGGSSGVFTLTKDTSLDDRLAKSPVIESAGDMMLGHALDTAFNNGPPPLGCQAGGGNLCAQSGLKSIVPVIAGANTLGPAAPGQFGSVLNTENLVSWGPPPEPAAAGVPAAVHLALHRWAGADVDRHGGDEPAGSGAVPARACRRSRRRACSRRSRTPSSSAPRLRSSRSLPAPATASGSRSATTSTWPTGSATRSSY